MLGDRPSDEKPGLENSQTGICENTWLDNWTMTSLVAVDLSHSWQLEDY